MSDNDKKHDIFKELFVPNSEKRWKIKQRDKWSDFDIYGFGAWSLDSNDKMQAWKESWRKVCHQTWAKTYRAKKEQRGSGLYGWKYNMKNAFQFIHIIW